MRGWYGPPIAVGGVPGGVYATGDGDFIGEIRAGSEVSYHEHLFDDLCRVRRRLLARMGMRTRQHGGFAHLADLFQEAGRGKVRVFVFNKTVTMIGGRGHTTWYAAGVPPAGAAGGAAPGGTAWYDESTGAQAFTNPDGGDTQHVVETWISGTGGSGRATLIYDRLFSVAKTMNSTGTEAVTGVPTRYQSTTATDPNYAGGNFLTIECSSALDATAHDWTVCQYTDQGGTTGVTLPSVTGVSAAAANTLDIPSTDWFCPLGTGDTGIKALTQMQCSAAVASGAIDFTIGHPIAWMTSQHLNRVNQMRIAHLNCAFNLTRIFDDACLAALNPPNGTSGSTLLAARLTTVAG